MSSTHTYTLGEREGDSAQPASMSSNEPEDDDDICPVCESECTCANRSRNVTFLPVNRYPTGYLAQDMSKGSSRNGPSARPPSLKIRLTLPARSSSSASTKASNSRSPFLNQKFKSAVAQATLAGEPGEDLPGTSHYSIHGETLTTGAARDIQVKNDVSIPKKRGRPTKAVISARGVVKNASEVKQAEEVTRQSIDNVVIARQSKRSVSRRAHQINTTARKKGRKLHGAAAASQARAQQRRAREKTKDRKGKRRATIDEDESSELSEPDDDDDHPFGLPTFVPALSSSSDSSSSDSGEDTDSDCDKGIPPFPLPQHTSPLPLVDNEHVQRRREYRNTWDIRVRKRSVGAEESSDTDMDTDSGEEEEEEGDDEAEADENDEDEEESNTQQLVRYSGIATGWTDDEESSFDADLFFANLSDTSSEPSDDEHTGNVDTVFSGNAPNGRTGGSDTTSVDAMRLSEAAAAGFLVPFAELERTTAENIPFAQSWDTLMDLDIDLSRRLPLGSLLEPPIPGYEEAEAMMATSEEEEAVAIFDLCSQTLDEDDVLEIFEDSDGGETTEDEFIEVDGIATPRREVLLRFPASLGAIDPMSTVCSPVREREHHEKAPSPITSSRKSLRLKPSDFLSGRPPLQEKAKRIEPKSVNSPPRHPVSAPAMGCFTRVSSKTIKHVVITKTDKGCGKVLPCPYPAVRRLRGRGTSVSMFSRSGSDRSYRSRTPSLLATARSPLETFTSGDFDSPDDAQLPPGEPIQLDDIIDAKLLEPERSDATIPESTASETGETLETLETCESDSERDRHLENLRRWDTIPIDAFRKTRTFGATNDLTDEMNIAIGTPRAPRPSDGFSYGSAASGMMRGTPLSGTLWGSNAQVLHQPSSPTENRRGKLASLLVSPVLLPVRDGDHTPTVERQQQRQQQQYTYSGFAGQHAAYTQQNIKSRKELRKEKKRNPIRITTEGNSSNTTPLKVCFFPNCVLLIRFTDGFRSGGYYPQQPQQAYGPPGGAPYGGQQQGYYQPQPPPQPVYVQQSGGGGSGGSSGCMACLAACCVCCALEGTHRCYLLMGNTSAVLTHLDDLGRALRMPVLMKVEASALGTHALFLYLTFGLWFLSRVPELFLMSLSFPSPRS
ncbi:hypothetical protein ACEPAI_3856 [Sanghuangporus weigelae]